MHAPTIDTADRIRSLLRDRGMSQGALAQAVGMDATALSKALGGRRRLTTGELTQIARTLETSLDWLAGNDSHVTVTEPPDTTALSKELYAGERGDTRRRIVEAAWTLIAERGFHQVRIRDVADRCGISTAAVHYHFENRLELLEDALRVSVLRAYDRQVAELEQIADATERLTHLIRLQLPATGQLRNEWSIWLQVWAESVLDRRIRDLHRAAYSRWHNTVRGVIEYGQQQGSFVSGEPESMARILTALVDGLGIQVLAGDSDYTVEAMRRALDDHIRTAIRRHDQ